MGTGEFPYVFPSNRPPGYFEKGERVFVHVGEGFIREARVVEAGERVLVVSQWYEKEEWVFDPRSPDLMKGSECLYFRERHLPLPEGWWEPGQPPEVTFEKH